LPATVTGLEVELIVHATEDPEKALAAIMNVLPGEARERVKLKSKELKGHHGNPIRLLRARVRDRALAAAIFRHVLSRLPGPDRERLLRWELKRRVSGGSLYLRLDKQWAFLGQVRLCQADPIWMKVKFSSSRLEDIREACEEACQVP